MFLKYVGLNIRRSPMRYFLLFVCMTTIIVTSLAANGILIDSINDAGYTTSYMNVRLGKQNVLEIRGGLYEFFENAEPKIQSVHIFPTLSREYIQNPGSHEADYSYEEEFAKTYGSAEILWFPEFEKLKKYLKDIHGIAENKLPTEEQYLNEKVIILGKDAECFTAEPPNKPISVPYTYTDENHVLINGEEYLAVGKYSGYSAFIFLGGVGENMLIDAIDIYLDAVPSLEQTEDLCDYFRETVTADCDITEPRTRDLLDTRKRADNIIVTVLIEIIAIFNVLIIYRFIAESRKKQFAVMRLCGFKKLACLLYMLGEVLLLVLLCLPPACVIFERIKPLLAKSFPTVNAVFTLSYYFALGLLFAAAAAAAFCVYIVPSFLNSVADELREM